MAAGLAGTIKAALALQNKTIPPTINFADPVPTSSSPVALLHRRQGYRFRVQRTSLSRRGLSFGRGTNTDAILEEAPERLHRQGLPRPGRIPVPLSARDPERLKGDAALLLAFVERNMADDVDGLNPSTSLIWPGTLQVGREAMERRLGLTCVRWPTRLQAAMLLVRKTDGLHLGVVSAVETPYRSFQPTSRCAGDRSLQ